MKTKKIELEVDFIGEQSGLTQAEEKALSSYFKQRKMASASSKIKQRQKISKREKVIA